MPSPLASAFLPLLVLIPIYVTLNVTSFGDYSWAWGSLSLACGIFLHPRRLNGLLGMWFTYAVMQIFFGGFSGLDNPEKEGGIKKGR